MKSVLAAAAAAIALSPFAARADQPVIAQGRQIDVAVPYSDLNLDSDRGAQVMLGRLANASMEACGAFEGSLIDYRAGVADSRCFREKMDRAVAEVGAPRLVALYQNQDARALVRRE